MTEPNDSAHHWQELAEQLGLDPAPEPIPVPPPLATPPAPVAKPAPAVQARMVIQAEPEPVDDVELGWRHQPVETPKASAMPQPAAVSVEVTPVVPLTKTPADEVPEEPARRGGRRRGRRSSTAPRSAADEAGPEQASEAAPTGEAAEQEDRPRRRGRGRSRNKKPDPDETERPSADQRDETEPPTKDITPNMDDDDDLSNWDIPSWNDLIASLYRPER